MPARCSLDTARPTPTNQLSHTPSLSLPPSLLQTWVVKLATTKKSSPTTSGLGSHQTQGKSRRVDTMAKPAEIHFTLVIPEWKATIICNCTQNVLHKVFSWFSHFLFHHYRLSVTIYISTHVLSLYCTALLLTSCLVPGIYKQT